MKYLKFTVLLLLINTSVGLAQKKKNGFDSTYVARYNDRLVIGLFQSQRSFDIDFIQKLTADTLGTTPLHFIARSNRITGFSIAYDKLSFSYGFRTPVAESEIHKKGRTTYYDYSFAFTSNVFRIELSYRNYKGFYDENTGNYDTSFNDTVPYFQREQMKYNVIKTRGFYFFNKHRFSYSSAYNNTYRQLKTAGSLFLYGDVFYNKLSDPVSFIPTQIKPNYSNYGNFNLIELYGLGVGAGYSLNIVLFKSIYANGTLGLSGRGFQQNIFSSDNAIISQTFRMGINGFDLRAAIGYNGKNFFASTWFNYELGVCGTSAVNLNAKLIAGSFSLGYRFPFKERLWVKKMKENKYYKKL